MSFVQQDDPTERKGIKEGPVKLRRNSRSSIFGKKHVDRHLSLTGGFGSFLWEGSYVLELFVKKGARIADSKITIDGSVALVDEGECGFALKSGKTAPSFECENKGQCLEWRLQLDQCCQSLAAAKKAAVARNSATVTRNSQPAARKRQGSAGRRHRKNTSELKQSAVAEVDITDVATSNKIELEAAGSCSSQSDSDPETEPEQEPLESEDQQTEDQQTEDQAQQSQKLPPPQAVVKAGKTPSILHALEVIHFERRSVDTDSKSDDDDDSDEEDTDSRYAPLKIWCSKKRCFVVKQVETFRAQQVLQAC